MIIYKIQNKINSKIYVGQTKRDINERVAGHLESKSYIGNALRKYSLESFDISVIDHSYKKEVLNEKEKYWIKKLNCRFPNGYNIADGGHGGNLGPLVNKKISKKTKGKNNPFYGKHHSSESIEKIREANTGKKHSYETIEKMRESLTGRKHSEETKQKMRKKHVMSDAKSNIGKYKRTEEHKRNIGIKSKGRKNPKLAKFNKSKTGQKMSRDSSIKKSASLLKFHERRKKI